jgi:hypothetical protein
MTNRRPGFDLWTVTAGRVSGTVGSRVSIPLAISRSGRKGRTLPRQVVEVWVQAPEGFVEQPASAGTIAIAKGVVEASLSGDLWIDLALEPAATVAASARWFVRFFLDGNNPIGFVELEATVEAATVRLEVKTPAWFQVPWHLPTAPDYCLFVTEAAHPSAAEVDAFAVGLSRLADKGRLRAGSFANPFRPPAGQTLETWRSDVAQAVTQLSTRNVAADDERGLPLPTTRIAAHLPAVIPALERELIAPALATAAARTLLILTEDVRFPWELVMPNLDPAAHPPQPGMDERFLGQLFAVGRWHHFEPLPNDGLKIRRLGLAAPEIVGDVTFVPTRSADRAEVYAVREFAAHRRLLWYFEATNGTSSAIRQLLRERRERSFFGLPEWLHLRGHGAAASFAVSPPIARPAAVADGEIGAAQVHNRTSPQPHGAFLERLNRHEHRLLTSDAGANRAMELSFNPKKAMSGEGNLSIRDLAKAADEVHGLFEERSSPPFLFLSFCMSADPSAGAMDNVAVGDTWLALLGRSGCSGFVATMWNIADIGSAMVASLFYAKLANARESAAPGCSVAPAAAMRRVRQLLTKPGTALSENLESLPALVASDDVTATGFGGDPTALAYTVFCHPCMTLRFQPSGNPSAESTAADSLMGHS